MTHIHPMLWFDHGKAQEAAQFYCKVFPNSRILSDAGIVVDIELDGLRLSLLNGGPEFKFTEAVSLMVETKDQQETDYYWNALVGDGGQESMCGWLKDKYGFSWQITPTFLLKNLSDKDKARSKRVFDAMMKMHKIDIATLEKAAKG